MSTGAISEDSPPSIGLGLSPYAIVTHSVKRRWLVLPVSAFETGSMTRSSAPYLETTILLVLLAWLVGGGVASLRQGSMG
ncbi:hypothetical protein TNCV_4147951 [Trichonephila clavipes]|nr:hypothetical protein TNCV_4147951 [Trichonephila clavipes]